MNIDIEVEDTVEKMTEAITQAVAAEAGAQVIEYVKLGRVIAALNEEASKGSFGFVKGMGFNPTHERKILQLLLDSIYKAAEVPR